MRRKPAGGRASTPQAASILVEGPWTHRDVSANGVRLHVAEAGSGPLVLLLHGFPEFWWTWRHQIAGLAEAGFRAVAPDLRGYGASDKPPRGYDAVTLAGDAAGLVRALGERDAVVVGHDWGGLIAWTMATLHARTVRRLVVLDAPHPRRIRSAIFTDLRGQGRATARYVLPFQIPRYGERLLTRDGGAYPARLVSRWSGPAWRRTADHAEAVRRYAEAIRIPFAAHSALEYYRWATRSLVRPDGLRYARLMQQPVTAPTLHLHGSSDPSILARTAQGSGRWVAAPYEWRLLDGPGHFPHEEVPDLVTGEILRWAKDG